MVNIRLSRPEEAEAQKKLWQMAFGDDPRYIDWFYACCWKPENMLLLLEDNKLASMLALLPHALVLPNGETASAYYVYALATDPAVRSKGFTTGFYTRKAELLREETGRPQPEDRVEPVSPQAYNAIRDRLLAGTPSVRYDTELIGYQEGMSKLSGGGLYRVVAGGAEGCAAVEYAGEGSVLFKELLLPEPQIPRALAAFSRLLPGRRCHVRTPACWDGLPGSYIQPFGMVKWYHLDKARPWQEDTKGYMGLGFD